MYMIDTRIVPYLVALAVNECISTSHHVLHAGQCKHGRLIFDQLMDEHWQTMHYIARIRRERDAT